MMFSDSEGALWGFGELVIGSGLTIEVLNFLGYLQRFP
jgi:hypothetical protein